MTTDLLLTLKRSDGAELVAISAKLKKDLTPENLEKLLLERYYWNRKGVRWILATEDNVHAIRAGNLRFFEMTPYDDRATKSCVTPANFSSKFEYNWSPEITFNEVMSKTIDSLGIDVHTGHALLGTAVWDRISRIDIDRNLLTHLGSFALRPKE